MSAVRRLLRLALPTLLVAVLLAGGGTATVLAAKRLQASLPALAPQLAVRTPWAAGPTAAAPIATPDQGSLALSALFGSGVTPLASSAADVVRPIASVAKTMTALAILDVHPLLPAQAGPTLVMTQQDVDDYRSIGASGGSVAPVSLGERFSERDLLIGLMLPSANNLALTAARWIDGNVNAFVRRLNARAVGLGMRHTHFADPDGLDPNTTSTAADLVILGETVVADDALLSVVSTIEATLPDGTSVQNLDILLGQDPGWIGVKTGWTPDAGGCLLFAARRTLAAGAPPLTIVGAVLGQPRNGNVDLANPELGGAFDVARSAVDDAYLGLATVRLGAATIPLTGHVSAPWGAYSALRLSGPDRFVLLRSGDRLAIATSTAVVAAPAAAGTRAGMVQVSLRGVALGSWALTTSQRLPGPSPWWRLLAG